MPRIARVAALLVAGAVLLGPGRLVADVPQLVSYQGVLMQDDAVVVPDGLYSLRFRVFRQEALGTPAFEQTLQVQVTNGLYHVLLSDNPPWTLAEAFAETPAYMEVTVLANGGSVPQDVVLEPRQQIASVPYALNVDAPEEVFVQEVSSTHVGTAISSASNPVVWTPLKTNDGSANLEVSVTPPAAGYVIEVSAHASNSNVQQGASAVDGIQPGASLKVVMRPAQP